jgi:mannose-6-phosphate isomerase
MMSRPVPHRSNSPLLVLENSVRPYAWGSVEFIPTLLGAEPSGEPAAEMWMGAHPAAPSAIVGAETSLLEVIAEHPAAVLGDRTVAAFGEKLPFLLKVLAAAAPLSIQAHPTLEQARAGFEAENERGVPLDSPERNYRDPNHKPELICALTDLDALVGFRAVEASADLLTLLIDAGAARLAGFPERLSADGGLREVVTALLTFPAGQRKELLDSVLPACAVVVAGQGRWSAECAWALRLAETFPGDRGVVLALLLNLVQLRPGQALFLSAGRVHAYLRGAGVEVMASSDNVLRCGLTVKHIDVPELLRVLDFTTDDAAPLVPVRDGALLRYLAPVADFSLSRLDLTWSESGEVLAPVSLPPDGPRILLCADGSIELAAVGHDGQAQQVVLNRGGSAFAVAGTSLQVAGSGVLFIAGANLDASAAGS